MTPSRRDGTGIVMLLALMGVVLIIAWPSRSVDGNDAWFLVAALRTTALALWGWFAGVIIGRGYGDVEWWVVKRLALAGFVTAPLEMVAHAGGVVASPLVWNLVYAPLLGVTAFAVSRTVVHAVRWGGSPVVWASSLVVLVVLGWLDLSVGPPVLVPWVVPAAPSLAAVLVLGLGLVVALALRVVAYRRRRDGVA